MIVYVSDLALEVTRRCNMSCRHCMRGDAQNIDISDDILETVAQNIYPLHVTFTGGEPSLNVEAIRQYFELAEAYGTMPRSFCVITNGKENREELASALLHAYGKMADADGCILIQSVDEFHEFHEDVPEMPNIFNALSFFFYEYEVRPKKDNDRKWVLNLGRAKENGLGYKHSRWMAEDLAELIEDENNEDGFQSVDVHNLYICANGNVLGTSECCYADADKHALCKVKDLTARFSEILDEDKASDCAD